MKLDANELLKELAKKGQNDRKQISIYLSVDLYKRFTKMCSPISASLAMERLLELFVESKTNKNEERKK